MKFRLSVALILSTILLSCNDNNQSNTDQNATPTFQNKGHELVYNMVQKVGNYTSLWNKKDVVYTYTYETPDGKVDVSTEKYLFDGELSYGAYNQHERTFPELEGQIEQGYDGSEFWLRHDGQILNDSTRMKRVAFNRPTNFYWFAMLPKLTDPGLNYEHLGEQTINDNTYDVVKVTFDSNGEKTTDIYQLYINKRSSLVDQFLFTVADFGVMENPNLMKLKYEEVDGMMIPTTRIYKKSNWEAEETDEPWIKVTWSNIKFNNGLTLYDFKK